MINGIFKTYLDVSDLYTSVKFYQSLGLEFASSIEDTAYFWVGSEKKQLLGLKKKQKEDLHIRECGFEVSLEDLKKSISWLRAINVDISLHEESSDIEPVVETWLPAAYISFNDPDGNSLSFLSVLKEQVKTDKRNMALSEWESLLESEKAIQKPFFDSTLNHPATLKAFLFEDLVRLDSLTLQRIFSSISDSFLIAKAFKSCSVSFTNDMFKCMPRARKMIILDAMEGLNVKLNDIKESQHQIASIVSQLDRKGVIVIPAKD